jgi:glutamate decarboxylase
MAPHSEKLKLMRVVVREDFSRARCDSLVADIRAAVLTCTKLDPEDLDWHKEHVRSSRGTTKENESYTNDNEDHSLKGRFDKSHPIC